MDSLLKKGTELRSGSNVYIIRSVLGTGGFGITYSATYSATFNGLPVKIIVAIKEHFIKADCSRSGDSQAVMYSQPASSRVETSRKDFVSEAKRLKTVAAGHPNIVKVSEVFEANNTAYYVMEYLEGESLKDYVRQKGHLSEAETLEIMRPIIEATAFLHQNRVTHLDIKPANIMLSREDSDRIRPVLIDFGLSKHYDDEGMATSTINTQGFSDGYAPIEQYAGITRFSPASDVYSLAATILFCLTGHSLPKSTELDPDELKSMIPANVSPALRNVLLHSLKMRAANRPADTSVLLKELNGDVNDINDDSTRQLDNGLVAPAVKQPVSTVPHRQPKTDESTRLTNPGQPEPSSATAPGAVNQPTRVDLAPDPEVEETEYKPKKKRRTWLWISLGLTAVIAIVAIFGIKAFIGYNTLTGFFTEDGDSDGFSLFMDYENPNDSTVLYRASVPDSLGERYWIPIAADRLYKDSPGKFTCKFPCNTFPNSNVSWSNSGKDIILDIDKNLFNSETVWVNCIDTLIYDSFATDHYTINQTVWWPSSDLVGSVWELEDGTRIDFLTYYSCKITYAPDPYDSYQPEPKVYLYSYFNEKTNKLCILTGDNPNREVLAGHIDNVSGTLFLCGIEEYHPEIMVNIRKIQ